MLLRDSYIPVNFLIKFENRPFMTAGFDVSCVSMSAFAIDFCASRV